MRSSSQDNQSNPSSPEKDMSERKKYLRTRACEFLFMTDSNQYFLEEPQVAPQVYIDNHLCDIIEIDE